MSNGPSAGAIPLVERELRSWAEPSSWVKGPSLVAIPKSTSTGLPADSATIF